MHVLALKLFTYTTKKGCVFCTLKRDDRLYTIFYFKKEHPIDSINVVVVLSQNSLLILSKHQSLILNKLIWYVDEISAITVVIIAPFFLTRGCLKT